MLQTYEAQLKSMSAFLVALLYTTFPLCRITGGHEDCPDRLGDDWVCGELAGELVELAGAVICNYRGQRYTVRELMEQLDALVPTISYKTPEDREHDYAQAVVSLAHELGPIGRQALLLHARYDADTLARLEVHEPVPSRSVLESEWALLSPEHQEREWQRFQDLCAQGIGDTHRSYPILIARALESYVGD